MALRDTDEILVSPEAIAYIEEAERLDGVKLAKCEIVELFFEWLKQQPGAYQISFLREALHGR